MISPGSSSAAISASDLFCGSHVGRRDDRRVLRRVVGLNERGDGLHDHLLPQLRLHAVIPERAQDPAGEAVGVPILIARLIPDRTVAEHLNGRV